MVGRLSEGLNRREESSLDLRCKTPKINLSYNYHKSNIFRMKRIKLYGNNYNIFMIIFSIKINDPVSNDVSSSPSSPDLRLSSPGRASKRAAYRTEMMPSSPGISFISIALALVVLVPAPSRSFSIHHAPVRALAHRRIITVPAATDGDDKKEESRSALQSKTWEFLKSKRLVGKEKSFKPYDGAGSEKTEAEEYAFAQQQSNIVTDVLTQAWLAYGEAEREEKRALKKKVLAGEELAAEERQRLEELKALNKAKKEAEMAAEGPVLRKTRLAFRPCNITGCIDKMSETFPMSSCGTEWRQTIGEGRSELLRSTLGERACNLLRVTAPLDDTAAESVVQLSLELSNELPPGAGTVDASDFAGLELDIFSPRSTTCSMLLKTPTCSTRAHFQTTPLEFTTVQLPWSQFSSGGPNADTTQLDITQLRRLSFELEGRPGGEAAEIAFAGVRLFV
jgi:hypothetical protein